MAESELLAAIAGMLDEKLKPVIQKLTDLGDRISGLEGRISILEDRVSGLEDRISGLEDRMSGLEDRVSGLEDRMSGIEGKVIGLEEKVSAIQKITAETQKELTEVKLHIENVTDKNITLLAENYCNLVNKLDENNKVTDVQLAYQIKVNFLIDDSFEERNASVFQCNSHRFFDDTSLTSLEPRDLDCHIVVFSVPPKSLTDFIFV